MDSEQDLVTDGGRRDPNENDIRQNAGRCDICGKMIEMDGGDTLSISEFTADDEVTEEHGVTDQDAADSVAEALVRCDNSPETFELAKAIRNELAFKVHDSCLEETSYDQLTVPADSEEAGHV